MKGFIEECGVAVKSLHTRGRHRDCKFEQNQNSKSIENIDRLNVYSVSSAHMSFAAIPSIASSGGLGLFWLRLGDTLRQNLPELEAERTLHLRKL